VVKIITLVPQKKQPSARKKGRDKGVAAAAQQPPRQIEIFKNTNLVDTMISNVLRDLPFSQNQPLKSTDE
jgi:hypothetical protein